MSILFFCEEIKNPIKGKKRKISQWIKEIICLHNKQVGDINFIFCSNNFILQINKQFLKHNYYTDVITFSYNENNLISGDIFISVEQVKENATELNLPFKEELLRVIVHGVLHLLGYNDKNEKQKLQMRLAENQYLEKINLDY